MAIMGLGHGVLPQCGPGDPWWGPVPVMSKGKSLAPEACAALLCNQSSFLDTLSKTKHKT